MLPTRLTNTFGTNAKYQVRNYIYHARQRIFLLKYTLSMKSFIKNISFFRHTASNFGMVK